MKPSRRLELVGILIFLCFISLSWATSARAALELSFSQETASLNIGEEGEWKVLVTNPDPDAIANAELTVTLPDDFTVTDNGGGSESAGPPHTLVWSAVNLAGNGGQREFSYKARPDCGAADNQNMTAAIYDGSSTVTEYSGKIEIKNPVVSITMVAPDGSSVAHASVGDIVTWTLTIKNNSDASVYLGADIKIDTGSDEVTEITSSSGHHLPASLTAPQEWNSGPISARSEAQYEIKVEVLSCDRDNEYSVVVNWGDGTNACSTLEARASVDLEINEPVLNIEINNPGPITYCPGGAKTRAAITISNSGNGPAENCLLTMENRPDDWKITPITTGLNFVETTNTFGITDIPPGETLTFEFDIEPDGSGCPITESADLVFTPFYTNQCGRDYGTVYHTPVIGPQTWVMAVPPPPTITVVKTGPGSAEVGATGLTYTVTATYTGPDLAAPFTTDLVDNYPEAFVLTDPDSGTVDSSQHTITWPASFQHSGDAVVHTIVMAVPDDPCLGFRRICNRASVSSVPDDCRGCPGLIILDNAVRCTDVNDTHGDVISSSSVTRLFSAPADVCSDIQFKTCYTFNSSGAPADWDGIRLDNHMSNPAGFTFVSIDKIEVNGTDYTDDFPSPPPSFDLDLSYLKDTAAPKPNSGATLCVTYTYTTRNSEGDFFRNISALTVPGNGTGCGNSVAFNVAADFSVEGSRMEVTAGGTPDLINTCEIQEYTITIGGFRTLYDAKVTLDTESVSQTLYVDTVSFTDIKDAAGNEIAPFEAVDNGDGTYTWDFAAHAVGGDILPQGTITFRMKHSCNTEGLEWAATGVYNNKCEDGTTPPVRTAPRSTDATLKVLDGVPTLHLGPATVFSLTPYPKQTVAIVNGGSGPLYNVAVRVSLDADLIYFSSSVISGSPPDSIEIIDDHNVILHYDEIESGSWRILRIKLKLTGCTELGINASLSWCEPDPDESCDIVEKSSVVSLPDSQVMVISHTGDKFDYCNDQPSQLHIKVQNSAQDDAYRTQIVELLPPGVTIDTTTPPSYTHENGYGSLSGPPTMTTNMVGHRQQIIWDFTDVLPFNQDSPQAKAMKPGSSLTVDFTAEIADCTAAAAFALSDKKASASAIFYPPCNFEGNHPGSVSAAKILATEPFNPRVTATLVGRNITKGTDWSGNKVLADPADELEWKITYHNFGDYVAKAVEISATLPTNVSYKNASGILDSTTPLPNDWMDGYPLFDMPPDTTHEVTYRTIVNLGGCTAQQTLNKATVKFGCCDTPPMRQTVTEALPLLTTPDFSSGDGQLVLRHANWASRCGGEVRISIINDGGSAANRGIIDTLPGGYEVDPNGPCTITAVNTPGNVTHAPFTCPTLSGDTITWGPGNIDFIAPNETIRIRFWIKSKTGSSGECLAPAGELTNRVVFNYTTSCGEEGSDSAVDTFTPRAPNIAIAITPTQQIVNEGDPATWTITLTNSGNAAAENLTLTENLGAGFSSPSDNQGGAWTGNQGVWNSISVPRNGGTWTTTVTATTGSGSLSNQAQVFGKCHDNAGNETCTYVDKDAEAYVAAFSLDKSVTPTTANVGELLTYRVTAVFSNTDEFQNVNIVDSLPPWVEYVSSQAWPGGNDDLGAGSPVVSGSPDATGQTLTWSPADFNGKKTFDYEITARILNNPANQSGTVLTNSAAVTFDILFADGTTSSGFTLDKQAQTTVTEPKLTLAKTISPKSDLQAGDTVTITLTATNNGDGPAYNVSLNDLINDNNAKSNGTPDGIVDSNDVIVYDCTTITEGTTPTDFSYSVSGTAPACRVDYKINGDNAIAPGASRTFSFTVQIAPSLVTGSNFINLATVNGWSLKPSDSETEDTAYDRKTEDQGSDEIVSEKVTDAKSLTATSESDTSGNKMAVGEVAEYRLEYTFPAGETLDVTLRDRIPSGLGYIAGSATLDRDDSTITTGTNPGGINSNTPGTPVSVTLTQSGRNLNLAVGNVTNNSGKAAHLILKLKCVTRNSSGNNTSRRLTDQIQMVWHDASGTEYTTQGNRVSVRVVEPVPGIIKTATPTSAEGGDTITFTVQLCNNATGNYAAGAFDWVFTDPLPADYQNPQVTTIDTGATGAIATASFSGNTLDGTIDQLDPGECVTVTYTAELIPGVIFGQTITNTAEFVTTSLPGDHGTGDATPGNPGTDTGERTGSGDINDLNGSDSASVSTNIPSITKEIVTPQTWYAIADEETFKLTLGIPVGTTSNFIVTDTLPDGLIYVAGSQSVTPPTGFTSTNPPTFSWDPSTRKLKWDFGNVTNPAPAADLLITYNVKVENVMTNQDGTTLDNSALLTYGTGQSAGPVTQTMTVGEPNLYMEKTPQTTPVDLQAGDSLRYRVEFWNNGHTTAWQMDWQDVLPNLGPDNGLYQITNPALSVVSGDIYQNGTTTPLTTADLNISTTTGADDTIALPAFQMSPGSHFYVEFDCRLMNLVVADETLTNETSASYASQVSGDNSSGVRDCAIPPCDDDNSGVLNNYGESAAHDFKVKAKISIVKTLIGGNDHFTIGEEFAYNLRTWVIEGVSPDVEVHDDIPTGLTLQSHQIITPGIGIISFSDPNYDTPTGNVEFDFGDVTNAVNADPTDDHFDVELTVKADNIPANQDGVVIGNQAFVRWTAGSDEYSQNVDINIIEPQLEVSKTVFPTIQARGDLVTYTVTAQHATGSTSDAFDLVIRDILPAGLTFISSTETNSGSGQNLEFHKASLLQGEQWQFTYTVRVDATTSGTLENSLELDWSSLAGADGSTHSGRNGIDCGQASPLNDYCSADKAPLQVVIPEIDLQKTVYLGHDSGASCPGSELVYGVNGKEITYCFTVTNTGDTYLNDFTIADTDLGITETDLTLVSGSSPLAPGQSLVYYYESAINGDLTNMAGVVATPTDSSGTPLSGASKVIDSDTAQVDEIAPQIEIAKTVYPGHDSGASYPGGELASGGIGAPVTYCFTVTNTGDTYLNDISIDDPDLGINVANLTLISGSQPLAPAAQLVYYYETTIAGDLTNTATASGNPTDATGTDLPEVPNPSATDDARVVVANPDINLDKTVYLGHDNGASYASAVEHVIGGNGADVTYCFTITNTGDTYLNNLTFQDNDLGITLADLTLLSGGQPLPPGGIITYYYESTITMNLTNTASVSANPTDSSGQIMPGVPDPSETDTAQVEIPNPGLTLAKTVYPEHDHGGSCPGSTHITVGLKTVGPQTPDCPAPTIPADLTYCFAVTNTGDTYLDKISIVDNQLGITEADMTMISGSLPLAPGMSVSFYYETETRTDIINHAQACGIAVDAAGNVIPNIPKLCADASAEVTVDPSIPTVNEWGIIFLLLMTSFISFYYMRKRRNI